jgi:Trk K+ transport system NAD-binding subunit
VSVLMIKRPVAEADQPVETMPEPGYRFRAGDIMLVMGPRSNLTKLTASPRID